MQLVLAILVGLAILVLGFIAPKLVSRIVIIGGFLGIVFASVYANGFPKGLVEGIAIGGLLAFIGWLRFRKSFADTERARSRLENNSKCKVCGNKLSYHRVPKKLGQLLLGRMTCKNCGAEYDISLGQLM
ncbi:MAG TPA: hypothetical protein VK206_03630 [Anaerolineales bacterium]|nr:hypothetical protein [Anaerolineales bacterium]HLO28785.1 hypothetical protein [Anaerolineales bacterium]